MVPGAFSEVAYIVVAVEGIKSTFPDLYYECQQVFKKGEFPTRDWFRWALLKD